MRHVLLTLVAAAALATTLPAQTGARSRPPTFATAIEVVNLNVSVIDGSNRYVTDLKQMDFIVIEDGVPQELSLFTNERLPVSLVLLIDTSASMHEKLPVAQTAALRFLNTLRPQDLAQVVQFNGRITVLQDFTSDRAALEAAVRNTQASGPTALNTALYVALKDLGKDRKGSELRRRAIVLLSDGEDTASLVTDEQVVELARKMEITVYSVAIRPDRVQDRARPAYTEAAHFLTSLARETGGQVYFPASLSDLDAVYGRIGEELRTQYSLGYVSANKRKDGKWRRIVVRTPQREGLQLRHKIGYYAADGQSFGGR